MKQTEPESHAVDYQKSEEYRAATDFLNARINFESMSKMPYSRLKLNLRRMSRLLEMLGDPHDAVEIIHVAGTKGKGSTVALLTAALQQHGLRCGSYTSPHLHSIEERFRLNGQPCTPQELVALIQDIRPTVEMLDADGPEWHVTYFEIATAMAFLHFVRQQVQIAIVEVGLGGRLDSTNVCTPRVSVITSISMDHMKQLGDTLALIAAEKAGIIKPEIPVVSGVVEPEPRDVIRAVALQNASPLTERDRDFRYQDYHAGTWDQHASFSLQASVDGRWETRLGNVRLASRGEHQAANASVAWAAMKQLPTELQPSDEAMLRGFAQTQCEARVEIVSRSPHIVVDTAHNPASATALTRTLSQLPVAGRRFLILAATKGKDLRRMLQALVPAFDHVICTRYLNNPRAVDVDVLVDAVHQTVGDLNLERMVTARSSPAEAWDFVSQATSPDDLICITGSFFIAGEMREHLSRHGR